MNLLLDTHAFIWFINGSRELPKPIINQVKSIDNNCFISIASLLEISIKSSIGKLKLKSNFNNISDFLVDNEIEILPITFQHLQKLTGLKYHHRDPFDRIIISQALVENITIVTRDTEFSKYGVRLLW